jgi:two-component system, OmpR family, heavy metal sensor histidine kinase CusS
VPVVQLGSPSIKTSAKSIGERATRAKLRWVSAPFRTSITGRLVSLFALTTFGILFLAGVYQCRTLSRHLTRVKTRFLSDQIETLRAVQEEHPGDTDALVEEIEVEAGSRRFSPFWGRVVERGQMLLETPGMQTLMPLAEFRQPNPDHPVRSVANEMPACGYRKHGERTFLLCSATSSRSFQPESTRVLQVAMDTSEDEALVSNYRRDAAVVVLLGTLFSTAAGWVIARRGLAPLRDVADHARRITAAQLHERVGATRWPEELGALSGAFDAMLDRLEHAFERLSRFAADLAHELRTPINNLMGEAEVALTRERSAAEYREIIESSREEYGQLSQIIDGLLFLARAENVDTPISPVGLEAWAEVDAVREFYEALAEDWKVEVAVEGRGKLYADSMLFRRALSNLLSNALNHTEEGGHVRVHIAELTSGLDVCVSDDGCGIGEEHVPHVLDRFYRVAGARSRGHGSGLGLAIVKSILDLHHGTVQIESRVGQGTRITLHFPARAV